MAVAPDGGWLASAGWDGAVWIWNPHTGEARYPLTGHTDPVAALVAAAHGSQLGSAGQDGTVRIWDVDEQRCIRPSAPATFSNT